MISVIIPCYNCEKFLQRSVESVFNQTYPHWEIILVNNNSTDGTQNVINHYVKEYPHKIFSFFEERKGACYARNLGLSAAKGDCIQFLDADDELLPTKFERQMKIRNGQADLVIGAFMRIFEDGKNIPFDVYPEQSVWHAILRSQAGITSSNLYKKEAVLAVNGWNAEMSSSQEYDLMFRLLKNNAVVAFDHEYASKIYEVPNSISRPAAKHGREKILDNYIKLRFRIANYLNETSAWDPNLRRLFSTEIYAMQLSRRNASLCKVNASMKELGLTVPVYRKIPINIKYFIKKILLKSYLLE